MSKALSMPNGKPPGLQVPVRTQVDGGVTGKVVRMLATSPVAVADVMGRNAGVTTGQCLRPSSVAAAFSRGAPGQGLPALTPSRKTDSV